MKKDLRKITVSAARLIIKYLHNSLTESEKDELDEWVSLNSTNQDLFAELTNKVDDNVFDPDKLIVDTEQAIDLWIIAGLIVREQQGMNNELEQQYLQEWVDADEQNRKLFGLLQNPAYMQKILVWNKLQREQAKYINPN